MNSSPDLPAASSHQDSNDVTHTMDSEPAVNQNENSSDEDTSAISPASYFKTLNLENFASQPLRMAIEHRYFMELCLEHHNPEAH